MKLSKLEKEAYSYTKKITKREAENFYWGILLLKGLMQKQLFATYSVCRLSDDIVDEPLERLNQLEHFKDVFKNDYNLANVDGEDEDELRKDILLDLEFKIGNWYRQDPLDSKLGIAMASTFRDSKLKRVHLIELIMGMMQDIKKNRYTNLSDTERYCYLVASTVGRMCADITSSKTNASHLYSDEIGKGYADEIGKGFQFTNIARDLIEDYKTRDRIYLDQEFMYNIGLSEKEFSEKPVGDGIITAVEYLISNSESHFENSGKILANLDEKDQKDMLFLETLRKIYQPINGILEKQIENNLLFQQKAKTPNSYKKDVLFGALEQQGKVHEYVTKSSMIFEYVKHKLFK